MGFFSSLDNELIRQILVHLTPRDICTVATVSTRMRNLVYEAKDLWIRKTREQVGDQVGDLLFWPHMRTYRRLCEFFCRWRALKGWWAGKINPHGQLLGVAFVKGCLVGRSFTLEIVDWEDDFRRSDWENYGRMNWENVFKIEPREGKTGELSVRCHWYGPSGAVGLQAMALSSTLAALMEPSNATQAVEMRPGGDSFTLTRPTDRDVWYTHPIFHGYQRQWLFPQRTLYTRIFLSDDEDTEDDEECSGIRPGLYWAEYGMHGPQIVQVSVDRGSIRGRKVTGDTFVPSGEDAFKVERSNQGVTDQMLNALYNLIDTPYFPVAKIHRGSCLIADEGFEKAGYVTATMMEYVERYGFPNTTAEAFPVTLSRPEHSLILEHAWAFEHYH